MVAQQVRVRESAQVLSATPKVSRPLGEGEAQSAVESNADALWRKCFKKWFVAMVASWMKDEVVNHTVLVLVGRQGIFKTTWLDNLIPPELRAYSSKLPLSGQISKDDRLRLCENGLLNIDELDAICGREMNIVKSLLTSTDVNERAAYGRLKERRVRLASFCASTNKREFLTDITGNRRWLPFEVESIQNPFHTIIPYERLYAQAKALVEEGIFSYWFDMEEMEVLEAHNEEFRAQENEEQLLPILFDVPAEGKGEFMTTAEISDRLVTYGSIKKPMSTRQLGVLLSKMGFTKKKMHMSDTSVRGWIVYERKIDEINLAKKSGTSGQADNIF
jgi:predicted P-loop ATPase